MKIETIDVYSLRNISHLSAVRCADFSEAAAVCLDFHTHTPEKRIIVEGHLGGQFELVWSEVTQQMRDSRNDTIQLKAEPTVWQCW